MIYEATCSICEHRCDADTPDIHYMGSDVWHCTDESACLERKAALPAVMDARDNPVPVIAAREDLEAAIWYAFRYLQAPGNDPAVAVAEIMAAADRYAAAATADHAGLDAILGPARLAQADAEYHPGKDHQ